MRKRKKLAYPQIQHGVNMAIYAIEFFEKKTDPQERMMIDRLLNIDNDLNGEHSAEFLRVYFSALMFMFERLTIANCPEPVLRLVSASISELARHYINRLEHMVHEQGRMPCRE